jgi:hypothetical protein
MGDKGEKKFEYEPLQHIVEKERTRTLIIEAVNSDPISVYWRHVVIMSFLSLGIAGYWWTHHTQRGGDFLEAVKAAYNKDPLAGKRRRRGGGIMMPKPSEDPDKYVEDAHAAWKRQETLDAADAKAAAAGNPDDMNEEMAQQQKSREALGAQLEAVGQGKMLPPSPDVVKAAMDGKAMPPPPSQAMYVGNPQAAEAAGSTVPSVRGPASTGSHGDATVGIDGGDKKEEELPTSLEAVANGGVSIGPVYRQVSQIPPPYAADKKEFPDIP